MTMSDDEQSESGAEEYVVEKILKRKTVRGVNHYLVKWEGYEWVKVLLVPRYQYIVCSDPSDNTWEPEGNLSCPDKVAEFEEQERSSRSESFLLKNSIDIFLFAIRAQE